MAEQRRVDERDGAAVAGLPIGVIERELLTLARRLETLGRRSAMYRRVDRAGYLVLRTLAQEGPLRTKALAALLGLDASTVTRQVGALERAGFVRRRADPYDGRAATLVPTAAGRAVMRQVEVNRHQVLETLIEDWSDEEQAALARSLTRLNASLSAHPAALGEGPEP